MCVITLSCTTLRFERSATTRIYTLSLHDALPICDIDFSGANTCGDIWCGLANIGFIKDFLIGLLQGDRKSTRLNSSHAKTSYAVFCLKKNRTTPWLRVNNTRIGGSPPASPRDRRG